MHLKASNLLQLFDEFYYQQFFPWNTTNVILGLSNFQTWSSLHPWILGHVFSWVLLNWIFSPVWFNPSRLLQIKQKDLANKQFFLESHFKEKSDLGKLTYFLSNFIIFAWLDDHALAVGFKMTEVRWLVKPRGHLALSWGAHAQPSARRRSRRNFIGSRKPMISDVDFVMTFKFEFYMRVYSQKTA